MTLDGRFKLKWGHHCLTVLISMFLVVLNDADSPKITSALFDQLLQPTRPQIWIIWYQDRVFDLSDSFPLDTYIGMRCPYHLQTLLFAMSWTSSGYWVTKTHVFVSAGYQAIVALREIKGSTWNLLTAIAFPGLQETIFREINSSLPVNACWNTCCAMVSHARRSIDTSIVSRSRVKLIQCQCKLRLPIANLGLDNVFLIKSSLFDYAVYICHLVQTLRQFRRKSRALDL